MADSGSFDSIMAPMKRLGNDAAAVVGKANVNKFIGFLALTLLLQLASKAIPADLSVAPSIKKGCDWAGLFFFVCGLIYLAIGFLMSPYAAPRGKNTPMEGFLGGLVAGCIAAIFGGAAYYVPDIQQCPTHDPVVKFMRLLPNCLFLGGVLGVFFGLYPPFTTPKRPATPPAPAHRGHAVTGRMPQGDQGTRVADFLVFVCMFAIFVSGLMWLDNTPGKLLGTDVAGKDQGNIVYWQYVCIIGTFTLSYFVLTRWKLGWNTRGHGAVKPVFCTAFIRGLIVILSSGLVLALIFGDRDIEYRIGRTGPDACSHAFWQDNSWLEVVFRIIVLIAWIYGTLFVSFSQSILKLDAVVDRACGGLRGGRAES